MWKEGASFALKVPHDEACADRLREEAEVLRGLRHTHIVASHGMVTVGSRECLLLGFAGSDNAKEPQSLADLLRVEAEQSAFVAEARRRGVTSGIVTGLFALVAASLGVFFWLGAMVRRPLVQLIGRAREMASGEADLTARLPAKSHDEMGDVARAFNAFVENLQSLVREVLVTAEEVARGSQEIQEASNAVLERANEQSDQTLRDESVAVCSKIHASFPKLWAEPDLGLAAFDEPRGRSSLFIQAR